jgi:hypothetical protein
MRRIVHLKFRKKRGGALACISTFFSDSRIYQQAADFTYVPNKSLQF